MWERQFTTLTQDGDLAHTAQQFPLDVSQAERRFCFRGTCIHFLCLQLSFICQNSKGMQLLGFYTMVFTLQVACRTNALFVLQWSLRAFPHI